MFETLAALDRALGFWLASHTNHPAIDAVMIAVTVIGAKGAVWIVVAVLSWVLRPAKGMAAFRLLLAIGLAGLLVDAITKPLIDRTRPWVDHPEYRDVGYRPTSASFPSGHAATAAAGALALSRMWPAAAVPAWTLAVLIAFSRLALGVHFPVDVLAGFAIGYFSARFVCARAPHPARISADRIVRPAKAVL